MQPFGILLCDDLIFSSRITGTARDLGLTIRVATSIKQLQELLAHDEPQCLILDLHHTGLDVPELLRQVRGQAPSPFVVGYGSHVDAATLHAARQGGCNLVLPRSAFAEELSSRLPQWFAGAGQPGS